MKCLVCKSNDKETLYFVGNYEIVKCKKCSLTRTDNFDFGKESYEEYHRDEKEYTKDEELFENIFRKRFNLLNLHFRKPGRVLDIGSSTGTMLNLFKSAGWDVLGIEPSSSAAKTANKRGIKTFNTYFEKAKLRSESFDLVIMNHTFEHVADPLQTLKKVKRALKKSGLIYVDVPNFDSLDCRIKGKAWGYLMPSEHVHHFTPETLKMVVEKSGLKVAWIDSWSGIFDVAGPIRKLIYQFINRPKSFTFDLLKLPFNLITTLLNKGTSLAVITQK